MRENIGLYRGKRMDNGEWAEGCLLKVTLSGKTAHLIFGDNFSFVGNDVKALSHALVDPDTVGQYTGMTENGKRIFEGDVVRQGNKNFRVDYGRHDLACCGCCFDSHEAVGFYLSDCGYAHSDEEAWHDLEIIGNIHDNPELMEGREA